MLLVDQALPGLGDPAGEERPGDQPGEDEDRVRDALGGDAREPPEDHREDEHRQERLEHGPGHAQDRLLVADLDVAPDEEEEQLAARGAVSFQSIAIQPDRGRITVSGGSGWSARPGLSPRWSGWRVRDGEDVSSSMIMMVFYLKLNKAKGR